MLLHQFPDLLWLKSQAANSFSNARDWNGKNQSTKGWPNVILNAKSDNAHRDNIRGPLSIFTNLSGKSLVSCGEKKVVIQPGYFFVTNHDQYYTLQIDKTPTETFNIHFGEHFGDQALSSIRQHPKKLIDEGTFKAPLERLELYNKLYSRDPTFNHLIASLQQAGRNKLLEEEKLYQLFVHLLSSDNHIKKILQEIPAIKISTRHEITKRLLVAVDYIYSFYDKEITLEELAAVSCLSKFHFLRLFKLVFKQTPNQFITEVKINRAKELLKNSKTEVRLIASALGFENSSSFSRVFYNHSKIYPSQFRRAMGHKKPIGYS